MICDPSRLWCGRWLRNTVFADMSIVCRRRFRRPLPSLGLFKVHWDSLSLTPIASWQHSHLTHMVAIALLLAQWYKGLGQKLGRNLHGLPRLLNDSRLKECMVLLTSAFSSSACVYTFEVSWRLRGQTSGHQSNADDGLWWHAPADLTQMVPLGGLQTIKALELEWASCYTTISDTVKAECRTII